MINAILRIKVGSGEKTLTFEKTVPLLCKPSAGDAIDLADNMRLTVRRCRLQPSAASTIIVELEPDNRGYKHPADYAKFCTRYTNARFQLVPTRPDET